jgi:hypothetical protein
MTTRADGLRRIATANATMATVSVAGVVGLSVMLAQQATHHNVSTTPTVVTSTTQTSPTSSSAATSSSTANTSDSASDGTATTVTATPEATVQQSTSGSVQHAVTSGS